MREHPTQGSPQSWSRDDTGIQWGGRGWGVRSATLEKLPRAFLLGGSLALSPLPAVPHGQCVSGVHEPRMLIVTCVPHQAVFRVHCPRHLPLPLCLPDSLLPLSPLCLSSGASLGLSPHLSLISSHSPPLISPSHASFLSRLPLLLSLTLLPPSTLSMPLYQECPLAHPLAFLQWARLAHSFLLGVPGGRCQLLPQPGRRDRPSCHHLPVYLGAQLQGEAQGPARPSSWPGWSGRDILTLDFQIP